MYHKLKYQRKLYIATFIAMFFIIVSTIFPAFADEPFIGSLQGRDGGVLDSALDYLANIGYDFIDWASSAFVAVFVNSFSPDFSVFAALESGLNIGEVNASGIADYAGIQHSGILSYLWSFGFGVGIVVVNILLLFNLFLCIAGQAKNIRENPAMLFLKYLIIMAGMYVSKTLANYIMEVISTFWSDFVCALPYGTQERVNFAEQFYLIQFSNGRTNATFGGYAFDILSASLGGLLYLVTLFLAWKIFKEFLKLYVEIIERYFILVLLIVFLPATISTAVSNNTKKIFSSYIRMIFSQAFVFFINTCLMKVFFVILMSGGWNAGLINYFACMAFLKVCQKVDSLMMLMGLNVSQSAGRVAGAFGGALLGAASAVRTLGSLDSARKNMGRAISERGLREANPEMYAQGQKLATPMADYITGNTKDVAQMAQAYTDGVHMLNKNNSTLHAGNVTPITTIGEDGKVYMAQTNADGSPKDFGAALQTAGVPATVATELNNYGYEYTDIGSVKQLDDSRQNFAIYDHNGVGIAGIKGSTMYAMEKSERDNYIKQANTLGEISGKPNEAAARKTDPMLSGDEYAHFLKTKDIPSAVQQLHGYGAPTPSAKKATSVSPEKKPDGSVSPTPTPAGDVPPVPTPEFMEPDGDISSAPTLEFTEPDDGISPAPTPATLELDAGITSASTPDFTEPDNSIPPVPAPEPDGGITSAPTLEFTEPDDGISPAPTPDFTEPDGGISPVHTPEPDGGITFAPTPDFTEPDNSIPPVPAPEPNGGITSAPTLEFTEPNAGISPAPTPDFTEADNSVPPVPAPEPDDGITSAPTPATLELDAGISPAPTPDFTEADNSVPPVPTLEPDGGISPAPTPVTLELDGGISPAPTPATLELDAGISPAPTPDFTEPDDSVPPVHTPDFTEPDGGISPVHTPESDGGITFAPTPDFTEPDDSVPPVPAPGPDGGITFAPTPDFTEPDGGVPPVPAPEPDGSISPVPTPDFMEPDGDITSAPTLEFTEPDDSVPPVHTQDFTKPDGGVPPVPTPEPDGSVPPAPDSSGYNGGVDRQNPTATYDYIPTATVNAPSSPPTSGDAPSLPHNEGMYVDARDTLGTERATYSIRQMNNSTGMDEIKHYDAEFKNPALNPDVLVDSRYKPITTSGGQTLYAKTTPKPEISKEGTTSPVKKDSESSSKKENTGSKKPDNSNRKKPDDNNQNNKPKNTGAKTKKDIPANTGTRPRPHKGRNKK